MNIAKGLIRTLRSALENMLQMRIELDHPLMPFMVEWAAGARNYYMVGRDGRTPMERLMGHRIAKPGFEFAEKVYFLPPKVHNKGDGRGRKVVNEFMLQAT